MAQKTRAKIRERRGKRRIVSQLKNMNSNRSSILEQLSVKSPGTKSKVNVPQSLLEVPSISVPVAPVVPAPIPLPVAPVSAPVEMPLDKGKSPETSSTTR